MPRRARHCATAVGACTLRAAIQRRTRYQAPTRLHARWNVYPRDSGRGELFATGDLNVVSGKTLRSTGPAQQRRLSTQWPVARSNHSRAPSDARDRRCKMAPADSPGGIYSHGVQVLPNGALGHIAVLTLARVVVRGCNSGSGDGGGLFLGGRTTTLTDTTITQNISLSRGGGLHLEQKELTGQFDVFTADLTRTTISGNFGGAGGGLSINGPDFNPFWVSLTDSTVVHNVAATQGGGLYGLKDYGHGEDSEGISVLRTTISGNSANQEAGSILTEFYISTIRPSVETLQQTNQAARFPLCLETWLFS